MAIHENHESISTNLPHSQLEKVLKALENGDVTEVPGSYLIFAESSRWKIDFEEARYAISEWVEEVGSVRLDSAGPTLLKTLIDELEAGLSIVIKKRDFDKAKEVDHKIQDLTAMLKI